MEDELYFKRLAYLLLYGWSVERLDMYDGEAEGWLWSDGYTEDLIMGDWEKLPTMSDKLEEIADELIIKKATEMY